MNEVRGYALWLCICSDDNLPVTWLHDGKGCQL